MPQIWNYLSLRNQRRSIWWLKIILLLIVVGAVVTFAIAWPVFRLVVKPRAKATIQDARLDSFVYAARPGNGDAAAPTSSTSFLAYNVSAAIRIHNPTWSTIKLTKPLLAAFAFHDHRLSTVLVAGKGHKYRTSKKELHIVHAIGEISSDLLLGAAVLDDFKTQNKTGAFKIDIRLSGEIAYAGLDTIGNKRGLGFSCPTTLLLAPPGPEIVVFHEVKCHSEAENINF